MLSLSSLSIRSANLISVKLKCVKYLQNIEEKKQTTKPCLSDLIRTMYYESHWTAHFKVKIKIRSTSVFLARDKHLRKTKIKKANVGCTIQCSSDNPSLNVGTLCEISLSIQGWKSSLTCLNRLHNIISYFMLSCFPSSSHV